MFSHQIQKSQRQEERMGKISSVWHFLQETLVSLAPSSPDANGITCC